MNQSMSEDTPVKEHSIPQPFTPIDQHLFNSRIVFVNGMTDSELAHRVNRELLALERANPDAPIIVWINSPGGEVYSGFAIYDMIQFIKPRVYTIVAGCAASMGSIIALAAEKEHRFSFPNAKLLIHQPLLGGVLKGSATDISIHAKDILELKKKVHKLYAERTGGSVAQFEEMMDRDRWVNPDEAVTLGLIAKVVKSRKELEMLMK